MNSIREQHTKIEQDILISRASITQTHKRKAELDLLITTTTNNVLNLKKDTESFAQAINAATVTAKDKAIGDATSYLTSHNDTLLDKMERVFACNMQLMEDEKDELDVDAAVQLAIGKCMTAETTKRVITKAIDTTTMQEEAQNVIVTMVKRQREIENTFKLKMDRDFKEKNGFCYSDDEQHDERYRKESRQTKYYN